MYLDFHVHIFADAIAARAIDAVGSAAGIQPETDGTQADTRRKLAAWGVDRAVILPIATKPTQQHTINHWAAGLQDDLFVCFGTLHPDAPDVLETVAEIKALGLHGVKLHPDYQGFSPEDPRMLPVYRTCAAAGLPVLFHAGYDPISPTKTRGTPEVFARLADAVPELTLILAHMGGVFQWDAAEACLLGRRNVYLDTSYISRDLPVPQLARMIRAHGADRILFASDCPWDSPLLVREKLSQCGLSEAALAQIYAGNANRLLGL